MCSKIWMLLHSASMCVFLTGCQTIPAPLPVILVEQPALLPKSPPAPIQTATAVWRFEGGAGCKAIIDSPLLSLMISVDDTNAIFVIQISRGRPLPLTTIVPINYSGASGSWTLVSRVAGPRRFTAMEALTGEQASQILFLLAGGTIRIGLSKERVPMLRVPNAGEGGRTWFDCVRKNLLP